MVVNVKNGPTSGECALVSEASSIETREPPVLFAIDPAEYQGWWSYTHPDYEFSLLLPPDWLVDETAAGDPLLNGHLLNLHPQDQAQNANLRMTFRQADETEVLLWPTGVGSGEFVSQGTLEVAGGRARVVFFVCPTGEVQSIWFEGDEDANIRRGDLEFGFIYILTKLLLSGRPQPGGRHSKDWLANCWLHSRFHKCGIHLCQVFTRFEL